MDGSIWVSSIKDERNVDATPNGTAFHCDKLVNVLGRVHWMMASNCEDTSKRVEGSVVVVHLHKMT